MYQTAQLLEKLHNDTEIFLQQSIQWQLLPTTVLMAKPGPERWSMAQCLQHLNFYGDYYLPAMERAMREAQGKGSRPTPVFHPGWLGAWFTNLMLPQADGSLKSKMQSPKNAVPSAQPDALATLAAFIEQQERMLQLLDLARTVNLNAIRVPISLSRWIRLKLGDTFLFYLAHHARHIRQAEKALAAVLPIAARPVASAKTG